MESNYKSCFTTFLGIILCIVGIYINFQYSFMHYIVYGILWGVPLLVGIFLISYVIYSFIVKDRTKKKKIKAETLIEKNPNGYLLWKRNVFGKCTDDKIIESESLIREIEDNYPIFEQWRKWGQGQSEFNNCCRKLLNKKKDYGYYKYVFLSNESNEYGRITKKAHLLWQFFLYEYSSFIPSNEFTHHYFSHIFDNNSWVESIKNYSYAISKESISKICDFFLLIQRKYNDLAVAYLIPEDEKDKELFFNKYYSPIADSLPSMKFYKISKIDSELQITENYIILFEFYTTHERQIEIAEQMINSKKGSCPFMIYFSINKEYSNEETQQIIEKKREEVEQERSKIQLEVDQGYNHVEKAEIEKATLLFKEVETAIENANFPQALKKDLNEHLEEVKTKGREIYVNIKTYEYWDENLIVDYSAPQDFLQSEDWMYAVSKFPKKGCHVYPPRRGYKKFFREGHIEQDFYTLLNSVFENDQIKIRKDIYLVISENSIREPDISLEIENHPIKIDIEIDEPYEAGSRRPIHYISCGDETRDSEFVRRGWIVVRFTEKQVKLYPMSCVAYLARLINALVPEIVIPHNLEKAEPLPNEKRWTRNEAIKMAANKEREQYLNHSFGTVQEKTSVKVHFVLNENEQKCNELVEKPKTDNDFVEKMNSFTDAELYAQDKYIEFEPFEHVYKNKKNEEHLLPVSSLIAYFFEGFDALKQAEMQWERYGVPIEDSINKWDRIGRMASEVGTFVHLQTENYFKELPFETEYKFEFKGDVQIIKVNREKQYFLQFVNDYNIQPYRQEWPIYDLELNVAGTVDLICKNVDGTFTIYDWKRSGKVVNSLGQPIVDSFGGKTGFNGISLPDTSFYHYCIQQNLYRYILEKNYHIKVNSLNLVVLWPEYPSYYVVPVPVMDEVIQQIVTACHEKDLGHQLLI